MLAVSTTSVPDVRHPVEAGVEVINTPSSSKLAVTVALVVPMVKVVLGLESSATLAPVPLTVHPVKT